MLEQEVAAPVARPSWTRRPPAWAVPTGVTLALFLLADHVLGLPATLVIVGVGSLAYGLGAVEPRLSGPASWAAAIVTEVASLSAEGFVLSVISGREHGRLVHLGLLVLPILLGLALVLVARRLRPSAPTSGAASRAGLAAVVLLGGLLLVWWVTTRGSGPGHSIAWALSGDGRNHVAILRGVLSHGGITIAELKTYPALLNALAGIVSAAGGRAGLPQGSLFLHDAHALAATYELAGLGLATMVVAALLEIVPRTATSLRRLPPGVVVVCLVASVTTVSSFVLGTALADGFFETYGTLPVAVAALVLALRHLREPSPYTLALLGVSIVFAIFGWTILAVVPFTATVAALAATPLARRHRPSILLLGGAVVAGAGLCVAVGILVTQYDTLRVQFLRPGPSPTPLQHWVIYLVGLVALAVLGAAPDRTAVRQRGLVLGVVALSWASIWWLRDITPDHQTWSYYASKSEWALTVTVLWIAFAPFAAAAAGGERSLRSRQGVVEVVRWAAAACAVLLAMGMLTKVRDPVHEAAHGWEQPSAAVVAQVITQGNLGQPFVLWHYSDPGDDRLGDFLAELTWASDPDGTPRDLPGLPGGLYGWGYADQYQFAQLCQLARAVPGIRVITTDPALRATVRDSCPASGAHVYLVPLPPGERAG